MSRIFTRRYVNKHGLLPPPFDKGIYRVIARKEGLPYFGQSTVLRLAEDWTEADLYEIPREKRRRVRRHLQQYMLSLMANNAKEKPIFPELREYNHFKDGCKVICYIPESERISRTAFAKGVYKGKPNRGLVKYECAVRTPHPEIGIDSRTEILDATHPYIMLEPEFRYLYTHLNFAKYWLMSTERRIGWENVTDMFADLGRFALAHVF